MKTIKRYKYPKGIKAVYDSGPDKGADRYTVYYSDRRAWGWKRGQSNYLFWPCVGMSASPFYPQGIGQHGEGKPGKHNGKLIAFEDLPEDCQKLVLADLGERHERHD